MKRRQHLATTADGHAPPSRIQREAFGPVGARVDRLVQRLRGVLELVPMPMARIPSSNIHVAPLPCFMGF